MSCKDSGVIRTPSGVPVVYEPDFVLDGSSVLRVRDKRRKSTSEQAKHVDKNFDFLTFDFLNEARGCLVVSRYSIIG